MNCLSSYVICMNIVLFIVYVIHHVPNLPWVPPPPHTLCHAQYLSPVVDVARSYEFRLKNCRAGMLSWQSPSSVHDRWDIFYCLFIFYIYCTSSISEPYLIVRILSIIVRLNVLPQHLAVGIAELHLLSCVVVWISTFPTHWTMSLLSIFFGTVLL